MIRTLGAWTAAWILSGLAFGRPSPLLGPDGPRWLGPLPPQPHPLLADTLGANPETGQLLWSAMDLAVGGAPDALLLERFWDGQDWTWTSLPRLSVEGQQARLVFPGSPRKRTLTLQGEGEPSPGPDRFRRTDDGWAVSLSSGEEGLFDDRGQPLTWETGSGLQVQATWQGDLPLRLSTPDGRWIEVTPPRVSGPRRRSWEALSSGGLRCDFEEEDGRLVAVTRPDGARQLLYHDEAGNPRTLVRGDGGVISLRQDRAGRVASIDGPGAETWTFQWTDAGAEFTDPAGSRWRIRRDSAGVDVEDGSGRRARLLTDAGEIGGWDGPDGVAFRIRTTPTLADARRVTVQGPASASWQLDLDAHGRVRSLIQPDGSPWRYDRDPMGRLTAIRAPDGGAVAYERGTDGGVREVRAGGRRVRFQRDAHGHVVEIIHGNHSSTRIERDGQGRVVAIEDPAGNRTRFTDHRGLLPGRIVGPTGETWALLFDRMGRPTALEAPGQPRVRWGRDFRGDLSEITVQGRTFALSRRQDGLPTRLRDPWGRNTGWSWTDSGHLERWHLPDGTRIQVHRTPRGLARALVMQGERLTLDRDGLGRVTGLATGDQGLLQVERDPTGAIRSLAWRNGALKIGRTAAGWIDEVAWGEHRLALVRDDDARVRILRGTGGTWEATLDATGLAVRQEGPVGRWRATRDPRGLVQRVDAGGQSVQYQYDASNRVTHVILGQSPSGEAVPGPSQTARLAANRTVDGDVEFLRLPDGSMVRFDRREGLILRTVEDPGGHPQDLLETHWDLPGRLSTVRTQDGTWTWRYGPLDVLTSLEGERGAWTLKPGGLEGPEGEWLAWLTGQRPVEAYPPLGLPAWGVARIKLAYRQDPNGNLTTVEGEMGRADVSQDALGRVTGLSISGGARAGRWNVAYDPWGGVATILGPEGATSYLPLPGGARLVSTPAGQVVQAPGPEGTWLTLADGRTTAWVPDVTGAPALGLSPQQDPVRIHTTPMGLPDRNVPYLPGWGGLTPLFSGGPLLGPTGSLDPVSGQGTGSPPIVLPWVLPGWTRHLAQPPEKWVLSTLWSALEREVDPWSDPLALLEELGVLPPQEGEDWWFSRVDPAPLPWLPPGLEGRVPLGPQPWQWPLELDPVSSLFLRAAVPPGDPVDPGEVLEVLLAQDLERLPPPPPGLDPPLPLTRRGR